MNDLSLEIFGGNTAFEPGSAIEVDAAWDLDAEPEAIELRTVWNTAGKGKQDVMVVDVVRIDAPSAREQRRITVTSPGEPYSFAGKLISLVWALELVVLPKGTSIRQEITIGPGAKEVRLPEVK